MRGAQVRKERNHGAVPLDKTIVTVAQVCEQWLAAKQDDSDVRPNTAETYGHALKPIKRHFADKRVQALKTDHIVRFTK